MWYKKPIWLSPDEVLNRYNGQLRSKDFTEVFLGQLVDSYILKGRIDRHKRKLLILEESVLVLIKHINYNTYCELIQTEDEPIKYSVPSYCDSFRVSYNVSYEDPLWVTPTDLLLEYPKLKELKLFDENFIAQLVHKKILRGKYNYSNKYTLVLSPSFRELHNYINYLHDLDKL